MFGPTENWQRILGVNLWGVINGSQVFAPHMIERGTAGPHHQHRLEAGHHHPARRPRLQRLQGRREGVHRGAAARAAQHRGLPGQRASADPRLRLHRAHRAGRTEKPAGAWTPEQTVDFMIDALEARRLLHPLPRQRRAARARRAAHPLGGRRHRREPPAAVALASGLRGGLREVREGKVLSTLMVRSAEARVSNHGPARAAPSFETPACSGLLRMRVYPGAHTRKRPTASPAGARNSCRRTSRGSGPLAPTAVRRAAFPQTASMRVSPCLTTTIFFSIDSRIRRSASSRRDCFDKARLRLMKCACGLSHLRAKSQSAMAAQTSTIT